MSVEVARHAARRAARRAEGVRLAPAACTRPALFTADGELLVVREDVGRHNAVDKVVGWAVIADRSRCAAASSWSPAAPRSSSCRRPPWPASRLLAAVSAPSSLAVELAEEHGMTLIGFLRGDSMNLYTGDHRVLT